MGPPAKSFRIALGALIIKEKLGLTDRETVQQIRENPYLQYFIGLTNYSYDYQYLYKKQDLINKNYDYFLFINLSKLFVFSFTYSASPN